MYDYWRNKCLDKGRDCNQWQYVHDKRPGEFPGIICSICSVIPLIDKRLCEQDAYCPRNDKRRDLENSMRQYCSGDKCDE